MDAAALIVGTLALRPYVFGFLLVYLLAANADWGGRRTVLFTGWAWAVAFWAEFSSTRIGVPFGLYHYTGFTRGKEIYLANVPLFDSLSFAFLAYAAFARARWLLGRGRGPAVVFLSGVLMMLLDLVIDPLAVRGSRWFLGPVFYYPEGGVYFGVPLSNFLGWALVGWLIVGGYLVMTREPANGRPGPGSALYFSVLAFNLTVTAWIGELALLAAGVFLHAAAFLALWYLRRVHVTPALSIGGFGRAATPRSEVSP